MKSWSFGLNVFRDSGSAAGSFPHRIRIVWTETESNTVGEVLPLAENFETTQLRPAAL